MIPGNHYRFFLGDKVVAGLLLDLTHLVFTGKAFLPGEEGEERCVQSKVSPAAIGLFQSLRVIVPSIAELVTVRNFRDNFREAENHLWAVEVRRQVA